MKKDNIPDFEKKISEQAAALRKSVRYSGAVAAADAKAGAGSGKTSFFSSPGVKLAAAFLTAAIVGGGTYFLCLQLGKSPVSPPPVNTEVTDTLPDDTGFVTEKDNAVTVPADTTLPDTTPEAVTEPETTQDETTEPETTIPETTVPETTVPETTTPETTVPETTAPETKATDTEAPLPPGEWGAPKPEAKNGYKLFVNHIDVTNTTNFGVDDEFTVLPFSTILNLFENGSATMTDSGTFTLSYESDTFTLKVWQYTMTGNHYSGNWLENKQTKTKVLYFADGILYADSETVNAFLSEFAGGSVQIDKAKKIISVVDFYSEKAGETTTSGTVEPTPDAKYTYSDIFDTDVAHLAPQAGVSSLKNGMKFKDVVAAIGKPHGVWRDNDNYFMWCVKGGGRLYLKCEYGGDKEYASLLHKYSDMYDNGTLEPITELVNGRTIEDYVSSFGNAHSAEYVVQYGDDRSPDIQKGEQIDIDGEYHLYHLEQKSKQKNHSLIEGIKVTDAATQPPIRNKEPDTYTLNIEVIDAGFTLSQKTQNLDKNDRRIWICDGEGNRIDYVLTNNYGMASAQLYSGIYRLEFEETEDAAVIYEPEPFSICFRGNSQVMHAVRTDIPKDPNNKEHRLIRIFIYDKREFVPFDVNIIDMDTNEPVPDHELIWEGGKYVSDENGKIHIEPIEIYTYKYLFKDNTDPYHPTAYKSNNVVFNFGGFKVDLKQQGYTDQTGVTVHVRDGDQTLYVSRGAEYRYEFEFVDDDNNPLPNVYISVNGENSTLSDESGRIVYELPSEYAFEPEIASVPLGKYYFSIQYGMSGERYDNVHVKPLEIDLPRCSTRFIVQLHKEYYYAQNDPETPVGYDCCFRIIEQIQL